MPQLVTGERLEALWVPAEVLDALKLHKAQERSKESLGRLAGQMLLNALKESKQEAA